MSDDLETKIPLNRALFYVILSAVLIWGTLFTAWSYHSYAQLQKQSNPDYVIRKIVASTSGRDHLFIHHISELLGLSQDAPINLYTFDLKQAKIRLESYPAVQSASIFRLHPTSLFVDYELRVPYFRLQDFENIALDMQGYPFPLDLIYSPKILPELYLGIKELEWGRPLNVKEFPIAKTIVTFAQKHFPSCLRLDHIDLSHISSKSYGLREIVLALHEGEKRYFLRLHVHAFERGLSNFLALRPTFQTFSFRDTNSYIIDLRFQGFALGGSGRGVRRAKLQIISSFYIVQSPVSKIETYYGT